MIVESLWNIGNVRAVRREYNRSHETMTDLADRRNRTENWQVLNCCRGWLRRKSTVHGSQAVLARRTTDRRMVGGWEQKTTFKTRIRIRIAVRGKLWRRFLIFLPRHRLVLASKFIVFRGWSVEREGGGNKFPSLSRRDSLTCPFFDLELGVSGKANAHGLQSRAQPAYVAVMRESSLFRESCDASGL